MTRLRERFDAASRFLASTALGFALGALFSIAVYAQGLPSPGGAPVANPAVQCGTGGAHMCTGGVPPAVSSCGTGASVAGSDVFGNIVPGVGATACTLTFTTPWNARPLCDIVGESNTPSYTTTQTQLLLTAVVAGVRYTWECNGQPGG